MPLPKCLTSISLTILVLCVSCLLGYNFSSARTENFVDSNNGLKISIEAPDYWNSGTASATVHNLNWRAYSLAASNDDFSAFFIIVNLPSLANVFVPFGQGTGLLTVFLKQYLSINNEEDINFSDGSSGHAYFITVNSDQLNRLHSILPSLNRGFDAVVITTQQNNGIYVIAYVTDSGKMSKYQRIFDDIFRSVTFQPLNKSSTIEQLNPSNNDLVQIENKNFSCPNIGSVLRVLSSSMEPSLHLNAVVAVDTKVPFEKLRMGDIIAFNRPTGANKVIIHRVVEIQIDSTGQRVITTKGDANPSPIEGTDFPIRKLDYIGKVSCISNYQ
ncbi:MAG TPA: signal peptidase I [Nitrososphaeraceae archaeon]